MALCPMKWSMSDNIFGHLFIPKTEEWGSDLQTSYDFVWSQMSLSCPMCQSNWDNLQEFASRIFIDSDSRGIPACAPRLLVLRIRHYVLTVDRGLARIHADC